MISSPCVNTLNITKGVIYLTLPLSFRIIAFQALRKGSKLTFSNIVVQQILSILPSFLHTYLGDLDYPSQAVSSGCCSYWPQMQVFSGSTDHVGSHRSCFKILGRSLWDLVVVVEMLLITKSPTGADAYSIFEQHEWNSWVVMFMVLLWLLADTACGELMLHIDYSYIDRANKGTKICTCLWPLFVKRQEIKANP